MKPRVGVSACLLGRPVRYDGASRPHAWIRDVLRRHAELLPICPETEAGLGVPRPPVQLVRQGRGRVVMRGVRDHGLDVTARLYRWLEQQEERLAGLDALIFKSRSPSCGLGSTPLYATGGEELRDDHDGVFAAWVRSRFSGLLLYDDVTLEDVRQQEAFLALLRKNTG